MAFDRLIRNAQSALSRELGLSGTKSGTGFGSDQKLPWNKTDSQEAFWKPLDIDPNRWDKMYPYRLIVIDITKPDRIVGGAGTNGTLRTKKSKIENPTGGIEYVLSQSIINGSWEFNLPITPQMLKVTDTYAINTTATMRGIVEEHNGIKFKTISASGSMGIWAQKPTLGGVPRSPSSIGSIFGGTLEQFSNVLSDMKRVKRAFADGGSHPSSVTTHEPPAFTGATIYSTGYYQILLMGQFIERYVQAKKDPRNKNWRLVFDIPKNNESFIVTPESFTSEKNQQKPMESLWSFQLKAWKRIKLESPKPAIQTLPKLNANTFQRIIGTIRETRRVLGNNLNLLKAVRSDFQKPLNALRQTSLAVKDLGGLTFTAIDLPRQLISDFSSSIKDSLTLAGNAFQRGPDGGSVGTSATGVTSSGLRASTQESRAGIASNLITSQSKKNEGLTQDAVNNGSLGLGSIQSLETDGTKNVFESPEAYFDLFDTLDIEDLSISREQLEAVDREIESIRLINIDDLKDFRNEMQQLALDISNNFGSGSQVYSDIYNRPDPKDRIIPMTIEENEILASLFEAIQAYDLLTSTSQFDDFSVVSPLEFVGGLANEAGIDFDQTASKLLVPVPFGLTIEQIAARYLRDPDKWVEIATLNKLTSPYIDEEGFTYSFISNGDGRRINVDDSTNQLYIGQRVILKSDTITSFSRKIIDVEKIDDNNFLVTLDGVADLDVLTTSDNASLQAYLPGTVNSQNQIYIPSDLPSQPDDGVKIPSHLDEDDLTRISKIDWLITDDGDLAINQLGEFRLANGLTNLVQALKLKVKTQKNTLMRHLDYGMGIDHGISIADIEAGELIAEMNKMIEDDARFSSIERIEIRILGNTLTIDMAVNIANGSGVVPISFNV